MESDKGISPIRRTALAILDRLREQVMAECSDEELIYSVAKFSPENNGYVREDEFVNYDEALKILHLQQNRMKLRNLCRANHIENIRFRNKNIGFRRSEIEMLSRKLDEKAKKMEEKRRRK